MVKYADPKQERFEELIRIHGGHHGIAQDEFQREQIPENKRCQTCGGTGNEMYGMYRECPDCKGDGLLRSNSEIEDEKIQNMTGIDREANPELF